MFAREEKGRVKRNVWKTGKGNDEMIINFSRHAKRRARLYNIPEARIHEELQALELQDGEHNLMMNIPGFEYPIKIVVSVERNIISVITSYPLKKGRTQ